MTDGLFNENMTSNEARLVFFSVIDGKSKEEIKEIKEEYDKVYSIILKRELQMASEGWLID